jgi:hypothetical protein
MKNNKSELSANWQVILLVGIAIAVLTIVVVNKVKTIGNTTYSWISSLFGNDEEEKEAIKTEAENIEKTIIKSRLSSKINHKARANELYIAMHRWGTDEKGISNVTNHVRTYGGIDDKKEVIVQYYRIANTSLIKDLKEELEGFLNSFNFDEKPIISYWSS